MRLAKLNKTKPKPLAIDMGDGDILNITYSREKYTSAFADELQKNLKANRPGKYLEDMLLVVLKSWDLTEDDPKDIETGVVEEKRRQIPVEITRAALHDQISIDGLSKIALAITENENPKKETSTDSEEQF